MTSLYVDRRGAELDYEPERLVVRIRGERHATIPLGPLERVVVRTSARLSARLLNALWRRGISLLVLDGSGAGARFAIRGRADTRLRLAQYALLHDEQARAAFAAELVRAKLGGQVRLLRRARVRDGARVRIDEAVHALEQLRERLDHERPGRARLRGLEGSAARLYFAAYARLLPPALGFRGRNRRPPRDPVNALLSLGYTLLHRDALREIELAGLDPLLGIYHDPAPGRESLACDLVEPLRPAVDGWVLRMFTGGTLSRRDFTVSPDGCRLVKAARARVYREHEDAARPWRRFLARTVRLLVRELHHRPTALPAPGSEA